MITTIILDIGQVLADFCWADYLVACGYDEVTKEKVSKATVLGQYWGEQDRGILTPAELVKLCSGIDPTVETEIEALFRDISLLVKEYEYAEDFVRTLKQNGYKIYLLSNYGSNFSEMKENFAFYPYVDGGVISYEVGHIKPEKEIYEALIEKYNIVPEEAVFLDDRLENLEAAEEFGIHTVQVGEFEKALEDLRALGVKI